MEVETTPWPGSVAPLDTLTVACEKDSMHVTVSLATHGRNSIYDTFNGIVYPAGLGSNSTCLREYVSERGDLQYTLPLRGCNTMSTDNVSRPTSHRKQHPFKSMTKESASPAPFSSTTKVSPSNLAHL
ncbi:unnamed protein product [Chrysodeixis includens]|uniref:ZP domain-containing protein n=1 Tax=Chrysodeixis includens TaxID=689277 RepID=A0A9P0GW94_CHRIL|nr:unnamed protein product [Chrysodeixis includens]